MATSGASARAPFPGRNVFRRTRSRNGKSVTRTCSRRFVRHKVPLDASALSRPQKENKSLLLTNKFYKSLEFAAKAKSRSKSFSRLAMELGLGRERSQEWAETESESGAAG
ncbi:hypothetical protein EVAR_10078_1 [Eumeta japonica]|uniref:Uncharacterized protein n=1 Tax=Eumeta variegata TaxID=151549 RepID=A0A4C1TRA1_EUMVA|nr:hypothetical protein EVAR_10078_1 [Eumeta japonica]